MYLAFPVSQYSLTKPLLSVLSGYFNLVLYFRPMLEPTTVSASQLLPPGNTKWGSITVPLTSCLTSLDQSVLQIKTKIVSYHTADSKPVKKEVNCTMILPPLVFPVASFKPSAPRHSLKYQTRADNEDHGSSFKICRIFFRLLFN